MGDEKISFIILLLHTYVLRLYCTYVCVIGALQRMEVFVRVYIY